MIAKVQPSRKGTSSPGKLVKYLTQEREFYVSAEPSSFNNLQNYLTIPGPQNEPTRRLRGDVILSTNLAGLDTAAAEMNGVAALNMRCKDPIVHFELSWPHDEHPTKSQWADSAYQSLKALGYDQHQYLIVAHDDKKHFHIHVMVNKIHPETLKAHNPHQNWPTLHKVARRLEAKYGWKHTPGLAKWNDDKQEAVALSANERQQYRDTKSTPTVPAAQFEHHQNAESLQTYIRREVATKLQQLLRQPKVGWDEVHVLLAKAHLRMERGEMGGYTVVSIDHGVRVKASDVFRNNFAGKANRERTEKQLGSWTEPGLSLLMETNTKNTHEKFEFAKSSSQGQSRDQQRRDERRTERLQARLELKEDYSLYKEHQLALCKELTEEGKKQKQILTTRLMVHKKEIRARSLTWPAKKILLSEAVSKSVIDMHAYRQEILHKRKGTAPKDYRSWVADQAEAGDERAAAQLRGWHYQDQRNQRKLEQRLDKNHLHIGPSDLETNEDSREWADLVQARLEKERQDLVLQRQITATRIWQINRTTGDVSYSVNGKVAVVDRGKILSVLNHEEAAIVFGLEMSIKKYGTRLTCTGSDEWKKAVAHAVIRHGIYVQFADPEINRLIQQEQRTAHPLQRQLLRLGGLQDRLAGADTDELTFQNETEVYQLLSSINPNGNAKQILQILRNSSDEKTQVNFGGMLTIQYERQDGAQPCYRIIFKPDLKRSALERVEKSILTTRSAIQYNIRVRGKEGMSR